MATATWTNKWPDGNGWNGTTAQKEQACYGHGAAGKGGRDILLKGDTVPSNAVLTKGNFSVCLSVNPTAGGTTRLYFLSDTGLSTFFIGSSTYVNSAATSYYAGASTSTFSDHGYYSSSAKNGIAREFTSNLDWFKGKSQATLQLRVNNSGTGTSYVRGTKIVFTYYIRCGDASNVTAQGGFKSLSATWTKGSSGTDDAPTYEICYNNSKSWNADTASTVTGTSKSWTINTAGTYYVGVRVTGAASGVHTIQWSSGVKVTTFEPDLVTQGNKILASDYNQIRTAYSALTAMTAGSSKIDDDNIAAVKNYSSSVSNATVGAKVTAEFFNNSVLKKIT